MGPTSSEGVELHCLAGRVAPPGLGEDLARMRRWPREALEKIWQVLAPSLAEKLSPETRELLDVFSAAYRIDDADLARAVKACRFLLREAARVDLPAPALAADLDRLCPDAPVIKELLLAGYEPARTRLRHEIARASLADHGNVLVGVKWRVDRVEASEQGNELRLPVAMLTLHYRDGDEMKRLTLQVLPDMLAELSGICAAIPT